MPTNSKFQINTSDTIKCISSSEDGRKIAFGNNNGDIFEGEILLNNIGFLVNCDLNFNDENFNQLIFESYPLI